jgi:hypothetical protein
MALGADILTNSFFGFCEVIEFAVKDLNVVLKVPIEHAVEVRGDKVGATGTESPQALHRLVMETNDFAQFCSVIQNFPINHRGDVVFLGIWFAKRGNFVREVWNGPSVMATKKAKLGIICQLLRTFL